MSLWIDHIRTDYENQQKEEEWEREIKKNENAELVYKEAKKFFDEKLRIIGLSEDSLSDIESDGTGCFVTLKDAYNEIQLRFETSKSDKPGCTFVSLNGRYLHSVASWIGDDIIKRSGDIWKCIDEGVDEDETPLKYFLADEPMMDAQKKPEPPENVIHKNLDI